MTPDTLHTLGATGAREAMSPKLTQPLRWHGGKHYLAKIIIDLMPPHLHYVEAYGGGLAVLLEKDPFDRIRLVQFLWITSGPIKTTGKSLTCISAKRRSRNRNDYRNMTYGNRLPHAYPENALYTTPRAE